MGIPALLNQVRYYPLVQLFIVGLFIIITITGAYHQLSSHRKTRYGRAWPRKPLTSWARRYFVAGMGGNAERNYPANEKIVQEMEKDVNRLKLVSDRFGKIGSTPHLEKNECCATGIQDGEYIRKRAPGKVQFFSWIPRE